MRPLFDLADSIRPTEGRGGARKACFPSLTACPDSGCAAPGSSHALDNQAKRATTADDGSTPSFSNSTLLGFMTLFELQQVATSTVGERKELPSREPLKNLRVETSEEGTLTVGEGSSVRIAGFIVGRPHANSGESVNCALTGVRNNDVHIPIAESPDYAETDGIVVETIPQGRNPAFTAPRLSALEGEYLMFVGRLFYDNMHRVNTDGHAGDPRRMSLFELHPVTQIYLCVSDEGCDPTTLAGWDEVK
ncbi:MAG: hypothetical protein EXR72_02360 [Myxococcales bacterium]|nr:hypothetical protein [Myxococcales bacterium]